MPNSIAEDTTSTRLTLPYNKVIAETSNGSRISRVFELADRDLFADKGEIELRLTGGEGAMPEDSNAAQWEIKCSREVAIMLLGLSPQSVEDRQINDKIQADVATRQAAAAEQIAMVDDQIREAVLDKLFVDLPLSPS